jgi:hypothetical protein
MYIVHAFVSTAPASPPISIVTGSPSSTAINVRWEEVPSIDQNGIIIIYEVCYQPLETFSGIIMKEVVNASELFLELTSLEEFIEYNISVRAYTSQGPGPFSHDITQMTQEDGMFILLMPFYNNGTTATQTANINARMLSVHERLTTVEPEIFTWRKFSPFICTLILLTISVFPAPPPPPNL